MIISARSVSWAVIPWFSRAFTRPISWVAIDLTLMTSVVAGGLYERRRRSVSLRRRRAPSGRGRRGRWRFARTPRGSVSRWCRTSSLIAAPACLSSCQSGVSATRPARRSLIVVVALRTLRRSCEFSTARLALCAKSGPGQPSSLQMSSPVFMAWVGSVFVSVSVSVLARISARWSVFTPARIRSRPPPMCIRHERSPAHRTSAPVSITASILSASIAADTSGFLIENVPPNPQHSS